MDPDWKSWNPSLLDLIPPERWQRLQGHLADVLGIGLRTVRLDRTLVASPSWPSGLDADKLIASLRLGDEFEQLLPAGAAPQEATTLSTPLGVSFAAVPLRVTAERIVAYFVAGPVVLGQREDAQQFQRRAADLQLEPEPLWSLLLTIRLYSFSAMRSVLRLLEDVGNTLLECAYQAQTLKALIPEIPTLDHMVAEHYRERLFQSLLDVATASTGAEGGSVMLYDRSRQALQIKAAHGLSEDVVTTTRLAPGEGIAGLVAAGKTPVLLDTQTADERLKSRMIRKTLVSSLVAPLVSESSPEPLGVLNLRTTNPQRRFNQEHVELLRRLLNLVGVALGSLHAAAGHSRPSLPSS